MLKAPGRVADKLFRARFKGHDGPVWFMIHNRFRFKVGLVKSLYRKQWDAEAVRKLFRFIDWTMDLPRDFELQFMELVREIEREIQMPYLTSIERLAELRERLRVDK